MRLRNICAFFLFFTVFTIQQGLSQTEVYWVGGSGDWNDINHWSDMSGGPGGVPTPNNQIDAIFDANSFTGPGQVVTIGSGAFTIDGFSDNLDWTGVTNNPTFRITDPARSINISGSLIFSPDMTVDIQGGINFASNTTGNTITSAGHSYGGPITFNGFDGEWTLTDALDASGQVIEFAAGSFISGNQRINALSLLANTFDQVFIDLGSSIVLLADDPNNPMLPASITLVGDDILFSAMQSEISIFGDNGQITLAGDGVYQFGRVNFTTISSALLETRNGANIPIFEELTFNTGGIIRGNHGIIRLILPNGNTVFLENGSTQFIDDLETTGDDCQGDARLIYEIEGGPQANLDLSRGLYPGAFFLRGINELGPTTVILTDGFNGGNNSSNFTFEGAIRTLYWIGDDGDWDNTANWSLTSGGIGGACIPKSQDNVIFDNMSFPGGAANPRVTSDVPIFLNSFTFMTNGFDGSISMPELNIIADNRVGAGSPPAALIITEPLSLSVPMVFLYSTNTAGGGPNSDNLNVDVFPGVLQDVVIDGEFLSRVRLINDLVITGNLDIRGDGAFNLNGFDLTVNTITAIDHPVTIMAEGSTITINGGFNGVDYPLTLSMIGGLDTDNNTEWIFTDEEGGFSIDMATLGNVTFTSNTGRAHMLVLQDVGINRLTIMNDGEFEGIDYAIDSLIFTAGHDYELGVNVNVSVDSYFEGKGDECSAITFHTSGNNMAETINLNTTISLDLSFLIITDVETNGSFFAGPGSEGTRATGWTFPTPQDNDIARRFLGEDIEACESDMPVLAPFEQGELQRITWEVDGVTTSNTVDFPVPQTANTIIAIALTNTGCELRDTVEVDIAQQFTIGLGNDRQVCQGSFTELNPQFNDPDATYDWSTGASSPTIEVSMSGTFSVTVTRIGCVAMDEIEITRIDLEPFDMVFGDQDSLQLCQDDPQIFSAPNFSRPTTSYTWNDGTSTPTLEVNEASRPSDGFYYIEVSEGICSDRDSLFVIFDPVITQVLSDMSDTTICAGDAALITAVTGLDSVTWNTGSMDIAIPVDNQDDQTYIAQGFRGACVATEERDVFVTQVPDVSLGGDVMICETESEIIRKPLNINLPLMWIDSMSGTTISTDDSLDVPIVIGRSVYILEAQDGLCIARDTIAVTVEAAPTLAFNTTDTTICAGENVDIELLTVESDVDYDWDNGATGTSINVSTQSMILFTADRGRCSVSASINVGVLDLGAFDIGPRDTTLCQGEVLALDATLPGGSVVYAWSTASTDPTIVVLVDGSYNVEVSSGACALTDTIDVAFDQPPVFDLHQIPGEIDSTICEGEILPYSFNIPSASYLWSDFSGNELGTTGDLDILAGSVTLAVSLGACTISDSIVVTVQENPELMVMDSVRGCNGEVATLTASAGNATLLWSTQETMSNIDVDQNGTYLVTATENNCSTTDSTVVTFFTLPDATLPMDRGVCDGDSLVLSFADSNVTYDWATPGGPSGDMSLTISVAGEYIVNVINEANCMASDTFNLSVYPTPIFSLPDSTGLCDGMTRTLAPTFAATPTSLRWSNADGNPTLVVRDVNAGPLWLDASIMTNGQECLFSDTTFVSVQENPTVDLGDDAIICSDSTLVLTPTVSLSGVTYEWSTMETTPTIDVMLDGTYSVTVDIKGCIDSDEVDVTTILAPDVELGMDTTICDGEMVTLSTGNPSWTTTWSTGDDTPEITVDGVDMMYSVTVEDNGCFDTDNILVDVAPLPAFDLGDDLAICDQVGVSITADVPAGTSVMWSSGEITNTINVNETGSYTATATSGDGCVFVDDIVIGDRDCMRFGIYTPTVFSPNAAQDGGNRIFQVTPAPTAILSAYEINIFNRWGNLMFTSSDPNISWDGSASGSIAQLANPGVYTYVIKVTYSDDFDVNRTDIIHGDVTLVD